MEIIGTPPKVYSPEEIIKLWGGSGSALDEVVKAACDPQYESERLIQINKARYNWQMVKGNQLIAPGFTDNGQGQDIVDWISVEGSQGNDGSQASFAYPVNVLGGDCYKFVAVMGQSAPQIKAVADDPADAEQLHQSADADAVLREGWEKLKVDQQWRIVALHQYTTGPVFFHTPFVVDGRKYGRTVEPRIEVQQIPQPDGTIAEMPVEAGVEQYDNGDVELHLYTVLEVSIPYGKKTLAECGWLVLEYMESKYRLLDAYPDALEQYRASDVPDEELGVTTTAANEARDSVSVPSAVGRTKKTNEWRFRQIFVRPWQLQAITDRTAREVLTRQYPNGLYIAKVGDITVAIDDRSMDYEWGTCKTGRGEKILEEPICSDSVPIQRALNDLVNLAIETVLRAIAKTVVDQMLIDRKSIATNEALPAEIIFTTTPLGTDISKMIAQLPQSRVSDQLVPLFQMLRALQQDITGIRPELSGGGAPTQTYREAKQRKDQALMQLGPQAAEMQAAAKELGRNIVRQRARYGSGTIKSSRKTSFGVQTDVVDMAMLAEDGWHCDTDGQWPMTAADTYDKLYGLLKEFSPEVAAQLSLLDPMNLERNLQILQLPGYESTFEDQKRKTLADIKQLLAAMPIEGMMDAPKQSSLAPDAYDDHQFVADFVRKWMVSPEGQREKQKNPEAFENVLLFQQAHQEMVPPAAPPEPAVKMSASLSVTPEQIGPAATEQILQGAGVQMQPGAVQPMLPAPEAPQEELSVPPSPESQEDPLPPQGPEGPQPQLVQ
jgi:hypothetical protein